MIELRVSPYVTQLVDEFSALRLICGEEVMQAALDKHIDLLQQKSITDDKAHELYCDAMLAKQILKLDVKSAAKIDAADVISGLVAKVVEKKKVIKFPSFRHKAIEVKQSE